MLRQKMVEMIAQSIFHQPLRIGARKLLFGLALEFRLANEDRENRTGPRHHVLGRYQRGLPVVDALAIGAQRACQATAQTLFMRAALQGRDGIAVGVHKGVDFGRPGDRPFHRALAVAVLNLAEEWARHGFGAAQGGL